MAMQFRPVGLPGKEYNQQEESQFRRNLESYLLEISSSVNSAESATSGLASSASKRESFIGRPSYARYPMHSVSIDSSSAVAVVGTGNFINYVGSRLLMLEDASSTIEYIFGAPEGSVLTLMKDGNTNTVQVQSSGTGNGSLLLNTGAVFNMNREYDNITFAKHDQFWIEISRTSV